MLSDSVHNRRSVCPRFCGLYNEALFATLAIRVIARVIQLSPRVPHINNILVKAAIERLLPWCFLTQSHNNNGNNGSCSLIRS